jgi:hypothetical protein
LFSLLTAIHFFHRELSRQLWMKRVARKEGSRRAQLAERGGIPAATGPAATISDILYFVNVTIFLWESTLLIHDLRVFFRAPSGISCAPEWKQE